MNPSAGDDSREDSVEICLEAVKVCLGLSIKGSWVLVGAVVNVKECAVASELFAVERRVTGVGGVLGVLQKGILTWRRG